jgi:ABC-2 family transporter protein
MTAIAPRADHDTLRSDRPLARVPWRRLAWVTWRQHRAALFAMFGLFVLAAALLWLDNQTATSFNSPASRAEALTRDSWLILLQVIPILAGAFLGAPLVARESENGTTHLAWTQEVSRTTWLLAKAIPVAVLLAIAAAGVGLELRWRLAPIASQPLSAWAATYFDLRPLPFAGWVTLGFCLGVFLGAAIRRTVAAMAATLACYAVLLYVTSLWWRMHYLPPLHRRLPHVLVGSGGSYGYNIPLTSGPGDYFLSAGPGQRDGRLLTSAQLRHPASWFRLHHIQLWVTYQPGSRFGLFQVIEFGWLIVLAAILITATAVLIRRRAA